MEKLDLIVFMNYNRNWFFCCCSSYLLESFHFIVLLHEMCLLSEASQSLLPHDNNNNNGKGCVHMRKFAWFFSPSFAELKSARFDLLCVAFGSAVWKWFFFNHNVQRPKFNIQQHCYLLKYSFIFKLPCPKFCVSSATQMEKKCLCNNAAGDSKYVCNIVQNEKGKTKKGTGKIRTIQQQ